MRVADVKRNLYRGSLAAVLRVLLAVPVYVVLTPFTLKYLGHDRFAIWSFNSTIIGLINLTDLGFKNSLLFHCAQNLQDREKIQRLFGAALLLYIGLWILLLVASWALQQQITALIGVPRELRAPAEFVIMITAAGFGLRFIATPFQSVIEAHYGVRYSQYVLLMWLLVNAGSTLLVLPLSPDLYALGWVSLASNGLVLLAFYFYVRRKLPFLGLRALSWEAGAARSLLKYGFGIYIATVMITLREPICKIFLSRHFGLPEVADFDIAFRLCTQIVSAVISPLLGTFAAAAVLSKRPAELVTVLRPLCGFTLLVLTPLTLFLMSFSSSLVTLWLGPSGAAVAALLPWMFAAFAVYYSTEVLYQALLGSGWSNYSALVQGLNLAIMLLCLCLTQGRGPIASVAVSLLAGFSAFSIANLIAFRRRVSRLSLFGPGRLLLFACPSLAYGGMLLIVGAQPAVLVPAFVVYVAVHLAVAKHAGIADSVAMIRSLIPRVARA